MKGRFAVLQIMPQFSTLQKNGVLPVSEVQELLHKYAGMPDVTVDDVIQDLYSLDIPQGKEEVFSVVVENFVNMKKEGGFEKNGNRN